MVILAPRLYAAVVLLCLLVVTDADKQEWLVPPHDAVALAERIRKWMVRSDRGKVPTLTGNLDIDHVIGRWLDFAQSFGAYQHSGVVDDVGKPNCR